MPSKTKAKNAQAHQHDKRHESGLAAPGRRVIRQRSNHNLANVNINGKTVAPPGTTAQSASQSTTSTGNDHGQDHLRLPDFAQEVAGGSANSQQKEHVGFEDDYDRERANSDASNECVEQENAEECHRMQACYDVSNHENVLRRRSSTMFSRIKSTHATISTILTYYPLRDAIAILILLLSLPATLILIIQTLFASLTFVPPTAGITIPSFKEMFNTSNLGYPGLPTIIIVDLIVGSLWLIMYQSMQDLLLDLSQAVVAVSLSGAAASNEGPSYSIITCSTIVCVVHVLRWTAIHLTAFDYLRSVLSKFDIILDSNAFQFSAATTTPFFTNTTTLASQHGWLYNLLRAILGIHIISQGAITCIRRSLTVANEKATHVPTISRTDTEAAVGLESSARSSLSSTPDQTHTVASTGEGRSRASSPGRTRESNSKKRRKQANEVRSKQPLWAAIASTKVTFVKEMEHRDAVDDAKETATVNKHDFGFTVLPTTTSRPGINDKVWITEVHDTEVFLCVSLMPPTIAKHTTMPDNEVDVGVVIDKSKPFFLRINGAPWSSAQILQDSTTSSRYAVHIFGLAPMSSYACEVVDTQDLSVLCIAAVITNDARSAEQVTLAVPPPAQPLRPSSPGTTLRKSIDQVTASINEARSRSRKSKKDLKSAYSDVRREINTLKVKLDGGMDDRLARRLQQITQHKNQADEATVQLNQQAQDMGEIPQDDIVQASSTKKKWQSVANVRNSALRASEAHKNEVDRGSREVSSEMSNTESKREKLAARLSQRREELAAILARQQADMSARQKHQHERTIKREEQEKTEATLRFHTAAMSSEAEQWNSKAVDVYQQGQALSNNWHTPPPGHSSPGTPEGTAAQMNGYSAYAPPMSNQYSSQQGTIVQRGRSSSMLSQYSGFTDNGDEAIPSYEPKQQYSWPQKYSHGSAIVDDNVGAGDGSSGSSGTNGSTASSSPRPDARSFIPAARISPIGPPSKKPATPYENGVVSPSPPPSGS